MTEVLYEQLPPARRRRLVLRASLQGLATTALLVVLYYALPLDQRSNAWTVTQLVLGLVVLAGILAWQVRAIIGSEFPRVRMVQALFVAVPFYVFTFAAAYFLIAGSGDANFAEPLSRTDALYFTVTVLSTVGFGDITPKTEVARLVVTVQMLTKPGPDRPGRQDLVRRRAARAPATVRIPAGAALTRCAAQIADSASETAKPATTSGPVSTPSTA